jgi:hypothetical protein
MLSDIFYGTVFAVIAAGISCLLALVGYKRPYYIAVFLPAFMLGCLLVAWFLYLREDRFMGSPSSGMRGRQGRKSPAPTGAATRASRAPEELLRAAAARDEEPAAVDSAEPTPDSGDRLRAVMRALLWAALELGAAASLLYSVWGVGAVYHG